MDSQSVLDHVFFYSSAECLDMIDLIVCYISSLKEKDKYKEIVKRLGKTWRCIFTEQVPHPTDKTKSLGDWFSRIGPQVKTCMVGWQSLKYKKDNPSAASASSPHSESEKLAETAKGIYSKNNTTDVLHLLKLIRNLRVHWTELNLVIRNELCKQAILDNDKFLQYFTIRYPGLILTLYEFCSEEGMGGISANKNLVILPSYRYNQAGEFRIVASEYLSEDQILQMQNQLARKSWLNFVLLQNIVELDRSL